MKKNIKYDEFGDRYYGDRLLFKENDDGSFCIINGHEELLGYFEKIRCGQWMHWCLLLEDGCYLSPGCLDEVREMQIKLATLNIDPKNNESRKKPKRYEV